MVWSVAFHLGWRLGQQPSVSTRGCEEGWVWSGPWRFTWVGGWGSNHPSALGGVRKGGCGLVLAFRLGWRLGQQSSVGTRGCEREGALQ